MEPKIRRTYLFYKMAKEVWKSVQEMYSDLEDFSQCFEVRSAIRNTKQGMNSVTKYFNVLVGLWHEMDMFYAITWESPTDSTQYNKMIERERIFDFLYGLNPNLDEVRGRILGTKPLLSLKKVFSEVRREESRRKVMLQNPSDSVLTHQHSTLASVKQGDVFAESRAREKLWCDHCKRPNHTKENCWKIHGKPANWKPQLMRDNPKVAAYNAEAPTENKSNLNLS